MPIPIVASPAAYPGAAGSPFGAPGSIVLAGTIGAQGVLPAGWNEIVANASIEVVQMLTASTSLVVAGAGVAGAVFCDGTNTRAQNLAAAAETLTYLPILGV